MERELEKTLLEIECSMKDHERRGNTHTQSVLEQARDIVTMCAQAARTPSDLKEILRTHAGWIPVEDRLPEDGTYLCTLAGELCGIEEPFTGMCGIENGIWDEPDCVIAWRPLPEPYRPENKPETPDWREGMLKKFDRRD